MTCNIRPDKTLRPISVRERFGTSIAFTRWESAAFLRRHNTAIRTTPPFFGIDIR
jgi:hypothetical protein